MNKYLTHSLLTHLFAATIFLAVWILNPSKTKFDVPVIIIEKTPEKIQNLKQIELKKPDIRIKSINSPQENKTPVREIFGLSRQSLTDSSNEQGIEVKKGNTTAKASDNLVMTDQDADSLPSPTEEYLVSDMPKVINEVRPNYPKTAKDERIQGIVIMDILVDQQGFVRTVQVIEGDKVFIQEAALAMKKFRFSPAKVDGKPVAVKIRYNMRFILEN